MNYLLNTSVVFISGKSIKLSRDNRVIDDSDLEKAGATKEEVAALVKKGAIEPQDNAGKDVKASSEAEDTGNKEPQSYDPSKLMGLSYDELRANVSAEARMYPNLPKAVVPSKDSAIEWLSANFE